MERASILLVDDRPENLIALEAILQPLGQRIVLARSGDEALRYLLDQQFACLLVDVQMPEMDGFETVSLIKSREKCRHIPVIFVTALSKGNDYVYRGYSSGAVDYISKPINPEILRSKVAVFVDLYNKELEIRRQAELLQENIRNDAERKQLERERELKELYLQQLNGQLEAKVRERTKELTETNRDLEAFCYSIAHDLRTPIREVVATSSLLLHDAADRLAPEHLQDLKSQCAAAKRMGQLIDDLLRLSRLGRAAIDRREVNLSTVAGDVFSRLLNGNASKYELDIAPELVVRADSGLMEILLHNLAENAIKYSPSGGTIRLGSADKGGQIAYYIADQGIGFDMRYERKLFLPFERLVPDPTYPGTGIGLAMVQKIVSKHGGRVWAKSEPGKGSTFFFTLETAKVIIDEAPASAKTSIRLA